MGERGPGSCHGRALGCRLGRPGGGAFVRVWEFSEGGLAGYHPLARVQVVPTVPKSVKACSRAVARRVGSGAIAPLAGKRRHTWALIAPLAGGRGSEPLPTAGFPGESGY